MTANIDTWLFLILLALGAHLALMQLNHRALVRRLDKLIELLEEAKANDLLDPP